MSNELSTPAWHRRDAKADTIFAASLTTLSLTTEGAQDPQTSAGGLFPAPENITNLLQAIPIDMKGIGGAAAGLAFGIGIRSYLENKYNLDRQKSRLRLLLSKPVQIGLWMVGGTVNYLGTSELPYPIGASFCATFCALGMYSALYKRHA